MTDLHARKFWLIRVQDQSLAFFGVEKIFNYLCNRVVFLYFFSPDLFMKISKFSKTVHTILHSHSTPKGAPACSKASKSYCWNVRNIAKISPKTVNFHFFSIFSKTVHTIRTKFCTVILHYIMVLCNFIKLILLGCEKHSQNYPENGQKTAIFRLFDSCKNCPNDSNEIFYSHFLHHSVVLCVQFQ